MQEQPIFMKTATPQPDLTPPEALEIIKIAVHRIILTSLKIWILFTHFIRRADRRIRAKLMHMIHKNAQYNADTAQKPSEFLSDIKEHKEKMLESVQKEDQ